MRGIFYELCTLSISLTGLSALSLRLPALRVPLLFPRAGTPVLLTSGVLTLLGVLASFLDLHGDRAAREDSFISVFPATSTKRGPHHRHCHKLPPRMRLPYLGRPSSLDRESGSCSCCDPTCFYLVQRFDGTRKPTRNVQKHVAKRLHSSRW